MPSGKSSAIGFCASSKAARAEKKACKNEAKTTQAYAVCKDARKLTGKAAGNALKCAGKYFAKPAAICVAQLFSSSE